MSRWSNVLVESAPLVLILLCPSAHFLFFLHLRPRLLQLCVSVILSEPLAEQQWRSEVASNLDSLIEQSGLVDPVVLSQLDHKVDVQLFKVHMQIVRVHVVDQRFEHFRPMLFEYEAVE